MLIYFFDSVKGLYELRILVYVNKNADVLYKQARRLLYLRYDFSKLAKESFL